MSASLLHPPIGAAASIPAEWQPVLFAERPRRLALRELTSSWPRAEITISVHRNAPFEYVAAEMPPFLAYAGYDATFSYSEYDDSLQFAEPAADLHLVWLDFERYRGRIEPAKLAAWLRERLNVLRAQSNGPVLISNWPADYDDAVIFNDALDDAVVAFPGTRIYDRRPILKQMDALYWDNRLRAIGATSLSGAATLEIARDLALRWVPAALRPRIKCIALDLDHTLYDGVLGEDGAAGLALTPAHAALQRRLIALRDEGMLLALSSKNDPEDVAELFRARSDFPLRPDHFSAKVIGWHSKTQGLAQIAELLRIGTDAILFVDDNLGEIAEVQARLPAVRAVHSADPRLALAELTIGPDLLAWTRDDAADVRANDLAASERRGVECASAADPLAYLATLETRLDFHLDETEHLPRIHDLSRKTNQFNLALKRLSEVQVSQWLDSPGRHAVTVRLSDRLSDSGIVAMILLELVDRVAIVEELCVSCRALGRKLEDVMILGGLAGVLKEADVAAVAFDYATGPRNVPARMWLEAMAGSALDEQGQWQMPWPPDLPERLARIPVTTMWH